MTGLRARLGSLAATTMLVVVAAAQDAEASPAHYRQFYSHATAVNTRDGRTVRDWDFDVRQSFGRAEGAANEAFAYVHCTNCRSLAVSVQVVVISYAAGDMATGNRAIGVQDRCQRCEALAFAYQFVVVGRGPVWLTGSGHRRLAELRSELARLMRRGPPGAQFGTAVRALAAEVQDVLATEVRSRVGGGVAMRLNHADD